MELSLLLAVSTRTQKRQPLCVRSFFSLDANLGQCLLRVAAILNVFPSRLERAENKGGILEPSLHHLKREVKERTSHKQEPFDKNSSIKLSAAYAKSLAQGVWHVQLPHRPTASQLPQRPLVADWCHAPAATSSGRLVPCSRSDL